MMISLFDVNGGGRHEPEGVAEIRELEFTVQLAVLNGPARELVNGGLEFVRAELLPRHVAIVVLRG